MIRTDSLDEFYAFIAEQGKIIGYHSSLVSASVSIEEVGFLPNKILLVEDYQKLIELAEKYKINLCALKDWLWMRSVTFTKEPDAAINHIKLGRAGGQGLNNVIQIIELLLPQIDNDERVFIEAIQKKIDVVRCDQAVTYIVDLTDLDSRLDPDRIQPFYYFRWNPELELPPISEIGPDRILLRLTHQSSSQ